MSVKAQIKKPHLGAGMLCPPLVPGQPLSGTLSILINGPPQKDANPRMNQLWVAQG